MSLSTSLHESKSNERNTFIYQIICVLIVDLLALMSGIHSTWTSPVIPKLLELEDNPLGRKLTVSEVSWIGSLLPLGAMFGPFFSAYTTQKIGRKLTMIGIAFVFVIAMIILILADSIYLIYAGRVISGLSHGSVFTVVPLYLAEISKISNRGIIGNTIGLSAIIGTLFSYAVGPYVPLLSFNIMCVIFPCLFLIFSYFIPESPKFLIFKDKERQACDTYLKLGIGKPEEFQEMKQFIKSKKSVSFGKIYDSATYLKPFLIALLAVSFKQLSGATAIATYTQYIFETAGTVIPPEVSSILVGSIECLGAMIAPFVVDRYGRRIMLIMSISVMMVSLFFVGLYFNNLQDIDQLFWVPLVCLVVSKFFFGFGIVSIVWILMAEILPNIIKSQASAIVNSIYWFLQFVITYAFPVLSELLGMGIPFWIFSCLNVVWVILVALFLPETKGKSEAQIEMIFKKV